MHKRADELENDAPAFEQGRPERSFRLARNVVYATWIRHRVTGRLVHSASSTLSDAIPWFRHSTIVSSHACRFAAGRWIYSFFRLTLTRPPLSDRSLLYFFHPIVFTAVWDARVGKCAHASATRVQRVLIGVRSEIVTFEIWFSEGISLDAFRERLDSVGNVEVKKRKKKKQEKSRNLYDTTVRNL